MTDPRRRFNRRERDALYDLAGGHCLDCGGVLDRSNFHADHDQPHSRGGITDVTNGRATCPPCNLRKGNRMSVQPRRWQRQFRSKYHATADLVNFLVVACPGAGKTMAALFVARDLLTDGVIDRVLIVVPGAPLREQWRKAAAALGIVIDAKTTNNKFGEMETVLGERTHGWVVTYASLYTEPLQHKALNEKRRTLVILDEVHHLSVESRWGTKALEALSTCARRLALSGTPFRGDKGLIPFLEYVPTTDGGVRCRYQDEPDGTPYKYGFDYSYGVALTDQPSPVRPVVFEHYDGDVEWMDLGDPEPTRVQISDKIANKKTRSRANRHVLHPAGGWLKTVLASADQRLNMVRAEGDPTAKGLVLCRDTQHADAVAKVLRGVTDGRVFIAVSNDEDGNDVSEDAAKVIESFGDGDGRWLVAVKMVSEGIDIPELRVAVYATTTRSQLFFRQANGRIVRRRDGLPEEVDQTAYMFVPKEPRMIELADGVQNEVLDALVRSVEDEDDDPDRDPRKQIDEPQLELWTHDPFRESNAGDAGVLVPGRGDLAADEVRSVAEAISQPYGAVAAVMAELRRRGSVAPATPPQAGTESQLREKPADVLKRRKGKLETVIKSYTGARLRLDPQPGEGFKETIAKVKTEIYEAVGIYRPGMPWDEKKVAYARADLPAVEAAIEYATKLLAGMRRP